MGHHSLEPGVIIQSPARTQAPLNGPTRLGVFGRCSGSLLYTPMEMQQLTLIKRSLLCMVTRFLLFLSGTVA